MSSSPASPPFGKVVAPARQAVDYLKYTWRRVTKGPKKETIQHRHISSPRPMGPAYGVCVDRTQLNDVVDDDELTVVPSNTSHYTSTRSSEDSPMIQDSDWRHFVDTPMRSSPSTFLGTWSSPLGLSARNTRIRNNKAVTSADEIANSAPIVDEKAGASGSAFVSVAYATPPASSFTGHSEQSSFLRQGDTPDNDDGSFYVLADTPTPAVRTSMHLLPWRRDTDSGEDIRPLLESACREVNYESTARGIPPDNTSDAWSFVSVRGESTTNDLLQYDTAELPANKRRRISAMQMPPRPPINQGESGYQQGGTARTHARYSGAYSLDTHRRVIHTAHGPAVIMSSSTES